MLTKFQVGSYPSYSQPNVEIGARAQVLESYFFRQVGLTLMFSASLEKHVFRMVSSDTQKLFLISKGEEKEEKEEASQVGRG